MEIHKIESSGISILKFAKGLKKIKPEEIDDVKGVLVGAKDCKKSINEIYDPEINALAISLAKKSQEKYDMRNPIIEAINIIISKLAEVEAEKKPEKKKASK